MTVQTTSPSHDVQAPESRWARRFQLFVERGWPLVLVLMIIGALLGGYFGAQRSDNHVAQASVFVSLDTAGSGTDINQGAAFIQSQMPSYAELVHTQLVLQPVAEELGIEGGIDALRAKVEVDNPPETAILTVSVSDPSSEQAIRIASRVIDEARTAIVEAADSGGENVVRVGVDIVEEPTASSDARGDETEQLVLIFALGGAVLGFLLLAVAAVFDRRLRGEPDVKALTDAPVVTMSATGRNADRSYDPLSIVQGVTAVDGDSITWVVIPAGPETDPQAVARGLVASRSSLGEKVAVVDAADLKVDMPLSPTGMPSVDTIDQLFGQVATHDRGGWGSNGIEGCTVLTIAELAKIGCDVRRPDHWEELIRWATKRGLHLVCVLGPMGISPGASALAARADAVILSTQRDRTGLSDLSAAVNHLRVAGGHLVAVVVER